MLCAQQHGCFGAWARHLGAFRTAQVRCAMADGADVETNTLGAAAPGGPGGTGVPTVIAWLFLICFVYTWLSVAPSNSPWHELASADVVAIGYNLRTVSGLYAALSVNRSRLSVLTSQNSTLDFVTFRRSKYRWRALDDGTWLRTYLVPMNTQQTGVLLAPLIRNMSETAVAFRATWRVVDPVRFATIVPGAVVDALETQLALYVGDALRRVPALVNVSAVPIEQVFGVEIKLAQVHTACQ